jgi:hypothetical protein
VHSPRVLLDAPRGTRLDDRVGDRSFHEAARALAVRAVAGEVDDRGDARSRRDGVERRFVVERAAGQECAGCRRRVDGSDPCREAALLPPVRHGEVVGPEDVDAQVADRASIAGPHHLGMHPVGRDPCRKRRPGAFSVSEVVRHDRGNQQPLHREGAHHLRKRRDPRARPVGEQDGIDPPDAQCGQCRDDAPGAGVAV